ncbi:MAG: Polyribonucleotide nucleotidyltransferase [Syntrophorhabdaceae bacterium PtaU1.Bin034]|nr:MAG: Polyribonucleotide nucleotidyltransferase [Syntrophorhabdaceae bacterium PtaU1.Bin034]
MEQSITIEFCGRPLTISTGALAKQADGSVVVRYGDTVVLVTAVAQREERQTDFLPLTVNYQEMSYAAGKFPGGFFKREGRPSEKETLTSRLIDRPLRPSFAKGYRSETQVIATVLSADQENDPATLGMIGASAALVLSPIPFLGPIAAVKVGRKDGQFIVNPTNQDMEESDLDIVVAGSKDAIMMVEGGASFVSGEDLIEAIELAHRTMMPVIEMQEQLREKVGKEKWIVTPVEVPAELKEEIKASIEKDLAEAFSIDAKQARQQKLRDIAEGLAKKYADTETEDKIVAKAFEEITKESLRASLLATGKRIGGRSPDDIRKITCDVGILPRTHGSGLFTRGETQALALTTFGTSEDEQKIESLHEGESYKSFMLHYNFPPFSVGEVSFLRAPSRREIGHGHLAERALTPILPPKEDFPYTIRIVSEILESNGSSSMASVCAGCLSLMDAGVPIKSPVAGIAMGLLMHDGQEIILSDILGDEDQMGDMDFKVAGSRDGITAVQMDIKIKGITKEIMSRAVGLAQRGIGKILDIMAQTLDKPRDILSPYAPRIWTMKIRPEKIREVIGPGGKVIKGIVEQTGVKIDIEDSGVVKIVSQDESSAQKAIDIIKGITREIEVGTIYMGTVKRVVDFGAIVEIMPGVDGLVHVSQLSDTYIKKVTDVVKEGDEIPVKVIEVEQNGRIRLSRKAALKETQGQTQ